MKKSKRISNFAAFVKFAKNFILKDLWTIETNQLPRLWQSFIRLVRIIFIAVKGFNDDRILLRASALTFYSILSVVPVVAMAFGIAKGFGFDTFLKTKIIENFEGQEEVMNYILNFADNFLEKSKGGIIAGAGIVLLIWAVMKVLGNVESSLNDIWRVKKSRTWVRKFTDYLSIMLIGPIFILLAGSMNVYITYTINSLSHSIEVFGYVAPVFRFLMRLTPYVLTSCLFVFLYMVMPNTKVKFKSGLVAGVVAGSLLQLVQWAYLDLQFGMSRNNAIYGSFAALPLFMAWMQTSWIIVLLGAELSFAHQNVEKIETETHADKLSSHQRKVLSLLVMNKLTKNFRECNGPVKVADLSAELNVPYRLLLDILDVLIDCQIVSEVLTDIPHETAYQPAMDINKITVSYVLERIQRNHTTDIGIADSPELNEIRKILDEFALLMDKSQYNKLLMNI